MGVSFVFPVIVDQLSTYFLYYNTMGDLLRFLLDPYLPWYLFFFLIFKMYWGDIFYFITFKALVSFMLFHPSFLIYSEADLFSLYLLRLMHQNINSRKVYVES